ncbi:unnamed protein product [Kuraishia capsulata CBS 1993]|uniref:Nucleolar protein Dnt1-like N-terminal domain-containing protein n=1 Tax=Kuraishia capsulata CBS 1993 TaxID=1382522 RepID=W6MQY8_9ASCO|nr:uncharacterized protein KUCA_T00000250001 [Kuraishia capsulata CBS 1993]CDK24290.1 unnamed protein product [Kuraishia capsulata CBS 1993]
MIRLQVYIVPPSSRHLGLQKQIAAKQSLAPNASGDTRDVSVLASQQGFSDNQPSVLNLSGFDPWQESHSRSSRFAEFEMLGMRKFLHITVRDVTLEQLAAEINERSCRIYPDLDELDIWKIQDSKGCDLDSEYLVWQVFDNNDSAIVLTHNELRPSPHRFERSVSVTETQRKDQDSSIPGLIHLNVEKTRRKSSVKSFPGELTNGFEDNSNSDDVPFSRITNGNRLLRNGFKDGVLDMSTPVGNFKSVPHFSESIASRANGEIPDLHNSEIPVKKNGSRPNEKSRITSGMLAAEPQPDLTLELEAEEVPQGVSVASKEDITKKVLPDLLPTDIPYEESPSENGLVTEESGDDVYISAREADVEPSSPSVSKKKRQLSNEKGDFLAPKRVQLRSVTLQKNSIQSSIQNDVSISASPEESASPLPAQSPEPIHNTEVLSNTPEKKENNPELESLLQNDIKEEQRARERAIEVEKMILKISKENPGHHLRRFIHPTAGIVLDENSGEENPEESAQLTQIDKASKPEVSQPSAADVNSSGSDSDSAEDSDSEENSTDRNEDTPLRVPVAVSAPKTRGSKNAVSKAKQNSSQLPHEEDESLNLVDPLLVQSQSESTTPQQIQPQRKKLASLPSLEGLRKRGVPTVRDSTNESLANLTPSSQKVAPTKPVSPQTDSSDSDESESDDDDSDSSDDSSDNDEASSKEDSKFIDLKKAKLALRKTRAKKNSGFQDLMKDAKKT